jgi:hypothetical protein
MSAEFSRFKYSGLPGTGNFLTVCHQSQGDGRLEILIERLVLGMCPENQPSNSNSQRHCLSVPFKPWVQQIPQNELAIMPDR